jgi:hypothetical protein
MLPGCVALRAFGAEGTHCPGGCISKHEPKNSAIVNTSELTRDRTHSMQVVLHSLECQESVFSHSHQFAESDFSRT